MREELRRRAPLAKAASEAALERSRAEAAECNRLAGLHVTAQQVAGNTAAGVRDLETALAATAEFAASVPEKAAG